MAADRITGVSGLQFDQSSRGQKLLRLEAAQGVNEGEGVEPTDPSQAVEDGSGGNDANSAGQAKQGNFPPQIHVTALGVLLVPLVVGV